MKRVIAITNQKGGVGKTTTSVNLAASLAAIKRRVLLIDMDPQSNATIGSGVEGVDPEMSVSALLLGQRAATALRVPTDAGYDLLPAVPQLTVAELKLLNAPKREQRLREALIEARHQYDVILIDCPPALNILTINALVAADSVLIPVQCEYYALEGLTALLSTIKRLRQTANPGLGIEGVLRTMYDGRIRLTQEVSAQLCAHFGDKVYQAVIPRNVRLAEAPSHGKPVLQYAKQSQGAAAYLALAAEMVGRVPQLQE